LNFARTTPRLSPLVTINERAQRDAGRVLLFLGMLAHPQRS
jgi:hypothetical protein